MTDSLSLQTPITLNTKLREKRSIWTRPTFSPEHGVLLVLFGSFLTGTALAQQWTYSTSLALICAFFALQAEHPYVVQIKLRKNPQPRYLLWGGIYGAIALSTAILLWFQSAVLLWVYFLAVIALIANAIAIIKGKHKSITNEIIGFGAICLAAPLAYGATTGRLSLEVMALWLLNTLFFSSAIYTIKLRRKKTQSFKPGLIYHLIAALIAIGLYKLHYLSLVTALSFSVALIKFGAVFCFQKWYRKVKFYSIALFETRFALLYIAIACVSLLPAHLPSAID
jgi:hypothetical protein